MFWNSLYVGTSNTFSAVCSVPSSFVSVAWGHETTTHDEHLVHNLDDTWLIIQALGVVFAAVYSFRSNASKQKVPRAQQAVPSMYLISKRTEFLDFASTQIYFYFVFYICLEGVLHSTRSGVDYRPTTVKHVCGDCDSPVRVALDGLLPVECFFSPFQSMHYDDRFRQPNSFLSENIFHACCTEEIR